MTKSDLIQKIAEKLKVPVPRAEIIVNTIFDSMAEAMKKGENISIRGVGTFEVRSYGAYTGRNPRTGETFEVAPKKLPFFRAGKDILEKINTARPANAPMPESADEDDDDDDDDDDLEDLGAEGAQV
jgi:integration host factor subunit beta